MVFANFSQEDKEAFFELLDEYFESRKWTFNGSTESRQPQPAQQRQERVAALYDYTGVSTISIESIIIYKKQSGQDLTFRNGDTMIVLDKPSADWWNCTLNGRTGLVPSNYVKVL